MKSNKITSSWLVITLTFILISACQQPEDIIVDPKIKTKK